MAEDAFPFTQRVRRLPATVPFVGPEALERRHGRPFDVRIGANESAFGISPRARQAMQQEIERISWYNDPENYDLREALARDLGLSTLPSATNFVSFDLGQAARAQTLLDRLIKRGVFVRKSNVPPLDRCVRVTVGTPAERQRFAEVLREVLHEVGR